MRSSKPTPVTSAPATDQPAAAVTERFYGELHDLARRFFVAERSGHTLQPTAVVNEACLRLLTSSQLPDVPRAERLALAGRVLKQVLVDHARGRDAQKRGGGRLRIELDAAMWSADDTFVDFEALHSALERLREIHPRQAEVVSLRIFSGLTMEQVAETEGVSRRTAEDDWTVARAWLRRELSRDHAH